MEKLKLNPKNNAFMELNRILYLKSFSEGTTGL